MSRFGMFWKETPPLTRRKRIHILTMRRRHRNTSACVEKTNYILNLAIFSKKHLRAFILSPEIWETPPRTRRKRHTGPPHTSDDGNTSAYAEKTIWRNASSVRCWKHLRVRGENQARRIYNVLIEETPPRTRRKLGGALLLGFYFGNTSAYAEKTGEEMHALVKK